MTDFFVVLACYVVGVVGLLLEARDMIAIHKALGLEWE